jgi:hypothetical protein
MLKNVHQITDEKISISSLSEIKKNEGETSVFCEIPSITTTLFCLPEQSLLQSNEIRRFYGSSSSRFHRNEGIDCDSFVSFK